MNLLAWVSHRAYTYLGNDTFCIRRKAPFSIKKIVELAIVAVPYVSTVLPGIPVSFHYQKYIFTIVNKCVLRIFRDYTRIAEAANRACIICLPNRHQSLHADACSTPWKQKCLFSTKHLYNEGIDKLPCQPGIYVIRMRTSAAQYHTGQWMTNRLSDYLFGDMTAG